MTTESSQRLKTVMFGAARFVLRLAPVAVPTVAVWFWPRLPRLENEEAVLSVSIQVLATIVTVIVAVTLLLTQQLGRYSADPAAYSLRSPEKALLGAFVLSIAYSLWVLADPSTLKSRVAFTGCLTCLGLLPSMFRRFRVWAGSGAATKIIGELISRAQSGLTQHGLPTSSETEGWASIDRALAFVDDVLSRRDYAAAEEALKTLAFATLNGDLPPAARVLVQDAVKSTAMRHIQDERAFDMILTWFVRIGTLATEAPEGQYAIYARSMLAQMESQAQEADVPDRLSRIRRAMRAVDEL